MVGSTDAPSGEATIRASKELENDPALVPGLIGELRALAERHRLFDGHAADRVELALTEALLNGIYHGNLEVASALLQGDEEEFYRLARARRGEPPWRDRRLHVEARYGPTGATFVVRDEGPGFDTGAVAGAGDPERLLAVGGRGLALMRAFVDDVRFNATGNEVTLIKARTT